MIGSLEKRINDLAILPHSVESGASGEHCLKKILEDGNDNLDFREILAGLVNEVFDKRIPTAQPQGFVLACVKVLRASQTFWAFDNDTSPSTLNSLDAPNERGVEARRDIVAALVDEAFTNRLLEYHRYNPSESTHLPLQSMAADTALRQLSDAAKCPSMEDLPSHLRSMFAARTGGATQPLFQQQHFAAQDVQQKLQALFKALTEEYKLRRETSIGRFALTMSTFSASNESSLDKASLRRMTSDAVAQLTAAPQVSLSSLYAISPAEVFCAFRKVSTADSRTSFKLRNKKIPDVPDRGGRANTFGFDRKVEMAVQRADADLRQKGNIAGRERNVARSGMQQDALSGQGLIAHGAAAGNDRSMPESQPRPDAGPRGGYYSRGGGGGDYRGGRRGDSNWSRGRR